MKKSLPIVILFFCCSFGSAAAQSNAIGMAYAPIGGHGFSMRMHSDEKIGYQFGGIMLASGGESWAHAGVEMLYYLEHNRKSKLYIPIGISGFYEKHEETYDELGNYVPGGLEDKHTEIGGGIGVGITRMSLDDSKVWYFVDLIMFVSGETIGPQVQIGMHYYLTDKTKTK